MAVCKHDSILGNLNTRIDALPYSVKHEKTPLSPSLSMLLHPHTQLIATKKLHLVNYIMALTFSLVIK